MLYCFIVFQLVFVSVHGRPVRIRVGASHSPVKDRLRREESVLLETRHRKFAAKDEAGEAGGKEATYHLLGRVQHVGHGSGKGSTHPTVSRIPSLHTPKMLIPNSLFH